MPNFKKEAWIMWLLPTGPLIIGLIVTLVAVNIIPRKDEDSMTSSHVAEQYVDFYCKGDFGNAYRLISDKDKHRISQKEFIDSYYVGLPNSKKAIFKKRTCQLKEIQTVNDTSATGTFIIQTPDYRAQEMSTLDKFGFPVFVRAGANMAESEIIATMKESLRKADNELAKTILSTTPSKILTDEEGIRLVYENNTWKVFLDIEAKNESDKLVKEGLLLLHKRKYKEAKETFKQALEKYPDNVSAKGILDVMNSPKYKNHFDKMMGIKQNNGNK